MLKEDCFPSLCLGFAGKDHPRQKAGQSGIQEKYNLVAYPEFVTLYEYMVGHWFKSHLIEKLSQK